MRHRVRALALVLPTRRESGRVDLPYQQISESKSTCCSRFLRWKWM